MGFLGDEDRKILWLAGAHLTRLAIEHLIAGFDLLGDVFRDDPSFGLIVVEAFLLLEMDDLNAVLFAARAVIDGVGGFQFLEMIVFHPTDGWGHAIREKVVDRLDYLRTGTIVLIHRDQSPVGRVKEIILALLVKGFGIGVTESINGLLDVADAEGVVVRDAIDEALLKIARVLIFIDHDEFVTVPQIVRDLLIAQ